MGFGGASGRFDEERVDAKQAELEHQERDHEAVSKAKYDAKLDQGHVASAASRGPLERLKGWFSAHF